MINFFTVQITIQTLLGALLIFAFRVVNQAIDTLRAMYVMRGKKFAVWILGTLSSTIYILVIASALQGVDNILTVVGYAVGYATGNVVGMWLEERLAVGYVEMRIISSQRGAAIRERLREAEYAVTEIPARGKDGMVSVLNCSVRRKEIREVEELTRQIDKDAFITAEDVRTVRHGFWGLHN